MLYKNTVSGRLSRPGERRIRNRLKKKGRYKIIRRLYSSKDMSLQRLCHGIEISRQAFYRYERSISKRLYTEELVVDLVLSERKLQPKIGARKLMTILGEELQGLGIGRDRLLGILREREMLIKKSYYRPKTTNSYHRFRVYENELKKEEITRIYQALVADITYIKVSESWYYLALITEVYSRLIIGYDLSNSLSIEGSIRALKMVNKVIKSIRGNCRGTIHHSDRGIQYCSTEYVNLLLEEGMRISMSEKGNPYENAIAERVNGILKEEYLLSVRYPSKEDAINSVRSGIWLYNNKRPHMSLGYKTPMEVYRSEIERC